MECFKVLGLFKEEDITHVITKTHANQAERMIRTVKKMIGDRLRHYKNKTWVEVPKPSLNRYNNQVHSSTKTTPNNAHNLDNVIQVRTNLILKENMLRYVIKERAIMYQGKKLEVSGVKESIK